MEASKLFVPGMWECPQCGFTQMNNVLSPAGVFASTAPELRPCPNDGWDMQPVTWEGYAKQILKTCSQMIDEREKDRLAIEELNERLIERQESFLAQLVRIEAVWREKMRATLLAAEKQRTALRVLLNEERAQMQRAFDLVILIQNAMDNPERRKELWLRLRALCAWNVAQQADGREPHGVTSAVRDADGWVLLQVGGEPLEEWPKGWPEIVDGAFLRSQGVEVGV